jgi:hypothetical protein
MGAGVACKRRRALFVRLGSVDAAALVEAARLVARLVGVDEAAALVGEADDGVGIVGILEGAEATREAVGMLMGGGE